MAKPKHTWKFFRAGGFDQVRLDTGDDLVHLGELDQKLWVALSCPTKGLEFDAKTLEVLDVDKDGRIRAPELLAATAWATKMLRNPDDLIKGGATLPLAAINDSSDEGKQLLASAREILKNLGRGDAKEISTEDTQDTAKIFAQTRFNGDGIVPADSAHDESIKQAIVDMIECLGGETDRSGKPGINQAKLDQFFADAEAYLAWWKKTDDDATILPLGEQTAAAAAAVQAVRAKVDDYFARCRLAAFDARAVDALNRSIDDFVAMAKLELNLQSPEIVSLPLARVEPGRALSLDGAVNPAFVEPLAKLRAEVGKAWLDGKSTLSDADWQTIKGKLAPFETWQNEKAGAAVDKLGRARVQAIATPATKAAIEKLIGEDKALEPEANAIAAVDKLVRLYRDLHKLLNNYVSFRDFYTRRDKAIFQAGTLYFDQRSCDMCMRVEDAGRHAAVANLSRTFLVYCDLVRKATGETMQIVASVTDGNSDNLAVGRNGIFYDRKGQDWDATITKIVDNPISIRQAFWSPYKKVANLVEQQIEKFASSRDKEVETTAAGKVDEAAKSVVGTAPPPAPAAGAAAKKDAPFDVGKFAGIFAAIGLAIGAIGGALGAVLGAFMKLPLWELPFAIFGLMLIISGPSMLLAWLKLRQRNLGPLLDANGWAINSNAKINIAFGASLTTLAKLPEGAQRDLTDPYADSHTTRNRVILLTLLAIVLGACWYLGALHRFAPWLPKSSYLEAQEKQAAEAKAAAEKLAAEEKAAAEKKAGAKAAADKAAADKAAEAKAEAKAKAAAEEKAAAAQAAAEKAAAEKATTDKK